MMAPKTLDIECAIVTGGAGGIGRAMAEWLLSNGKRVILVGRTESKLASAAKEMGSGIPFYSLDTGKTQDIPAFVERVTKEHPEVDCLINNAGIQRPFDINDFDVAKADQEIDINIRGPLHLTIALLPHFKAKAKGAVVMNVSSVLGYIPTSVINPVYNGTKSWIHLWSMNLRTQLKESNIKVVEIVPPTVSTDLHRERSDPDDNKKDKNSNALSISEFMGYVTDGWKSDKDVIGAGSAKGIVERWYTEFGHDYEQAAAAS